MNLGIKEYKIVYYIIIILQIVKLKMLIPLIKNKFKLPKLPSNYTSREGILKKLEEGFSEEKKLTLVVGNAGYGKSSLVVDYIQQTKVPYLWYSLNENDSDLIVFINHLSKGLKLSIPNLREDALELLISTINPIEALHNIIGLLIEDLSIHITDKFIIVLDDYQFLRNSEAINKALEYLIEYLPENFQLIIISRYTPNIKKLPQLKVRQQVIEVPLLDLKFSVNEIQTIIPNELRNALNEEELTKLYTQTDGWIGIIILLIQAYKSNLTIKEHLLNALNLNQPVFDYLTSEIFELQDKEIKSFMLNTSLLPKINKEICNEVMMQNVSEKLDFLKNSNLLEIDNEDEYKYNPVFRDFLREKAKETLSLIELQSLYFKIGNYLQKKEDIENALEYFLLGPNYAEAEDLLLDIAQELIDSNRLETLNKFIFRFPEEYLEKSSNLQIYLGEIYRLWGNYSEALEHYYKAEDVAIRENNFSTLGKAYVYESIIHASKGESSSKELIDEAIKILPDDDSYNLAFAYNTKGISYLFGDQIFESLNYFEKSLKYYEEISNHIGQAKVLHNLGYAYTMLGSFEHARDTYERSIKQAESSGKYPYIMTYNNIAIIYNYSGNFNEARKFAEKALNLSQKLQYKRDMSYAYWTLGMISANLEDFQKSEDYFNLCLSIGLELGDRQVQAYSLSGLSELARLQEKPAKAFDLIEEAIRRRDLPPDNQGLIELLMQKVAICIETKNYKMAQHDIETYLLQRLEKLKYKYYLTHIYFFLAIIYEKTNKPLSDKYVESTYNLIKENNYYFFLKQQKYIPSYLQEKLENKTLEINVTIPSKIKFYCFGEFKAFRTEKPIPNKEWNGFKTKLSLAYLIHNPKGVTKEQLANLLYPDMDITRTAINVILTRLRKAIEPDLGKKDISKYISFNEGKYFFNFGTNYWLDTEEFNYLLKELAELETEEKKLNVLNKLVSLYNGDFLSEFGIEIWCEMERQIYRRKIESVFESLFQIYYKTGEFQEIVVLSEKELSIDVCNEKAFQRKIKALIAMNKKEEGMKHYKIMKNILKSELGVEPSSESYLLYQKLV